MITSFLLPHLGGHLGGRWIGASRGTKFSIVNPATGEVLAELPDMGENAARKAIDSAFRRVPACRRRLRGIKSKQSPKGLPRFVIVI